MLLINFVVYVKTVEFGFCDPHESSLSPIFNFRTEYREDRFDPTTLIIFRVDTIEPYSKRVRVIGYTGINLFVERGTDRQPTDHNSQNFCLNIGAFQLPLYV